MNFKIFIFSSLAITIVGLLVGTIELVYMNNVFAKKSFTKKILYKMLLYTLMLFVITLITFPIAASLELGIAVSNGLRLAPGERLNRPDVHAPVPAR